MKLTLKPVELVAFYHRDNTTTYLVMCQHEIEVIFKDLNLPQWALEYMNDHEPDRTITLSNNVIVYHYYIESEVN